MMHSCRACIWAGLIVSLLASPPRAAGGQSAPVEIVIAATTDIHGRVRGWDYFADTAEAGRGLARIATIFDSLRAAAPGRAIFVDAGDFLQGNPVTYVASRPGYTAPNPVITAMNALKYDAAVVGNHEFNYGLPFLDRSLAAATFPVLAANVRRIDGKRGWAPAAFFDRGGVRVAIVGVTTTWSMVWDKLNLNKKLEIDDIVTSLRRAVKDARAAGAQVVVVVAHAGLESPADAILPGVGAENPMTTVANEVPGIDAMVLGHTHRELADTTINGVLIVQPRNWATSVAVATLRVERNAPPAATGRGARAARGPVTWSVTAKHGAIVRALGHAERQAILDIAAVSHAAARKYTATKVGNTAVEWRSDSSRTRDTPIIDFIGEIMRRSSGADVASTAVFSTQIRIPPGPVTVAQLAQLYPYDNYIRVVRMSGTMLKAYLEQSARYFKVTGAGDAMHAAPDPSFINYNYELLTGAEYTIDLARAPGDRIVGLKVKGRPVAPTDSINVALTSYRASGTGGYGMIVDAPIVRDNQAEIRQLLIDEITKRKEFKPADFFTQSWSLTPPALAAEAQAAIDHPPDFEAARRPAPPPGSAATAAGQGRARASVVRVIATNDFHGGLEAQQDRAAGKRGGAAQFASVIRRLERECTGSCTSILVDGGDLFQGTPASNLAYGRPVMTMYNALGFAAAALGNHDFDWGQDTLRARMREARFNILGANVTDAAGRPVPWIRPDTIVERGGIRIGIVGFANPGTAALAKPVNIANLRFLPIGPIAVERARQLRARGAEFVIVTAHSGSDCDSACGSELAKLADESGGAIDAIVGGHAHLESVRVINGVPLMRARSSGRAVATVDVPVDRGARTALAPRVVFVTTDSIAPEPDIARLVADAVAPVAALVAKPVATVAADMHRTGSQYALGNFVADAQRVVSGTDVAAMNNGGIRADLQAGPATYDTFFQLSPFGNALVRLTVSGKDLLAYFERLVSRREPSVHLSGAIVRYDPAGPPGGRIIEATVGGARLDPARTYTIVMNDFMSTGGDGLPLARGASRVDETAANDLDALLEYVRTLPGNVVRPDSAPRLIAVPR